MAGCFGPRLFGYQNWASSARSTGANAPVRRNDLTSGRVVESDDFGCASMRHLRLRVEQMPIPKEEFSAWFEWARGRFAEVSIFANVFAHTAVPARVHLIIDKVLEFVGKRNGHYLDASLSASDNTVP